jgi:hypothetical protein
MTSRWVGSRRAALTTLAGGLAAARPVWAQAQPHAPVPRPDNGAYLETAFDAAVRLTVGVRLNGQGPYAFVIDTGANRSVVAQEVALECRLPRDGSAPVHGIVSMQSAPLVKVGRLTVGDVISSSLSLPVLPQQEVGAQGILGLDAMHGRRIVLGFRDQTFQIAPSATGAELSRGRDTRIPSHYAPVTVPCRYRSGQLVILDAEAGARGITAFLDSGSQVTVGNAALRDLVFDARPELAKKAVRSELISATGQRVTAEFAPLDGLRLGGARLGAPLAAFADLHIFDLWDLRSMPTVLIGVDVLRRFDQVAFDFGHKTVTFWPGRNTAMTQD